MGDAGIAAPIVARDGVVAGAIGVVGAADRLLVPGTRDELARAVDRGGPGHLPRPGRGPRRRGAVRAELRSCGRTATTSSPVPGRREDLRRPASGRHGCRWRRSSSAHLGHAGRADAERPHAEADQQRQDQRVGGRVAADRYLRPRPPPPPGPLG